MKNADTQPMFRPLLKLCSSILLCAFHATAATQFDDDFHTGTDSGWTHLEPLASFGSPGTYSFPNGGYRIQAQPSPNPTSLGPARVGSFRVDLNTGNFEENCEIVGWSGILDQSIGLLAHVTNPGFGTTMGYALLYSTAGSLNIQRLDGEGLTTLGSSAVSLDPTKAYNLEFVAFGGALTGIVYDQTSGALLTLVQAEDSKYNSGVLGLYLLSNSGGGSVDATFDNFHAVTNIPEPSTWRLFALGAVGLLYACRSARKEARG